MNVEWRRKTEQSAASSSKDQWMGGAEAERKGDEGGRKGEARGEGSSRGHEELEASAKELVMIRLPLIRSARIQLKRSIGEWRRGNPLPLPWRTKENWEGEQF